MSEQAASPKRPVDDASVQTSLEQGLPEDEEQHDEKQDPPPKEGTLKAYLALLAGFLGIFVSFGWVNCVALFQAEYETNQLKNYSSSEVSWIPSIEFFLLLFLSPLSGYLFDNFGPRLPVFIGGLLQVFGLMMTSLSSKYYQIMLSQSIVAGIGPSLLFNPCITAPMTYFRRARALAGGVTVAGSSVGGVVFPLMVNHLLPKIGFAWTMRVCAFLVLGLWVIVVATISSNIPHKRREFNFWNFLGRTIPNILADKYGRFNILIIMLILTNVVLLAVWLPGKSNAAIIVFAALFGVGSGACIGLAPVLTMNLTPSHSDVGFRMGAALAVGGIAALTSPPIGGAISARSGGTYDNAFIFAAANGFVATAVLIILRGRVVGWSLYAKEGAKK
ncbi:major facilitator superfamily domain-containing protein [Aspergillus floccosus]